MKFYRKLDGAVFGGVLSGVSAEYNIDLLLLRIVTLLLFFISAGLIGLIYIILWTVLPAVDSDTTIKEEIVNKLESLTILKDNKKNGLILGGILIVIGLLIFLNFVLPLDIIIKVILPVILVGIGILFILKNK